jgi:hypothetical protein
MRSCVLTDVARDLWVDSTAITPATTGLTADQAWSVHKQTLRGGRRDGVDLILVNNGAMTVSVLPTRGMGIWRAQYKGVHVGWDSPIGDGPVHPSLVNLMAAGGLGWLDGFDELLARCGLEHNGAPYRQGDITYPLHGRIANIPAHFVAVEVAETPPHAISVEGCVDEARLFGPKLRMRSLLRTDLGSSCVTVRDMFTNLGDVPSDLEILYHWNFGPPYLGEGSRLVAPVKTVVPRDAVAAGAIGHYEIYGPPQPGSPEHVFLFELHGDGPEGRTVAMLRSHAGDHAVVLRFSKAQLPCFTLWKNMGGRKDGYVTGLEPGTNYPNPKPFEQARGRVVRLEPGAEYVAEMTFEVLEGGEAVAAVEAEVRALQGQATPKIHAGPVEPYVAA